jgi:hypothetical protein
MKTRANLRPQAKAVGPPDFQIVAAREQAYDVTGVKGKLRLTSKVFAVSKADALKIFKHDNPSYAIEGAEPLEEYRC